MNEIERISDAVILCNQRDIIRQEADKYQKLAQTEYASVEEYKYYSFENHAPKKLFLLLSIVLGFFCGLLIAFNNENSEFMVGVFSPIVIIISSIIIYNLVFKKIFYALKKSEYDNYAKLLCQAESEKPEIINLMTEARNKQAELEEFMRDEDNCIIPEMYWDNANMIFALIKNKRAHDLESAINEFEQILHRMRMENMANESLEWQRISAYNSQIAAENAQIAAENSKIAADNSRISAIYSICNYYHNRS